MGIRLFNTLSRKKEDFVPREPGRVGIYVCGVTVYDYCHIGHARVMVAFDVVVRHLRARGLDVTYVRNFTDIDDKIIRRANENGETIQQLTSRFIDAFHEDMQALAVLKADIEPKATEHLDEMRHMIGELVAKDLAYPSDGDVYYAVRNFPQYGRLSGKPLTDLEAGARVAVGESKRDPMDFVLWKGAKPDEPQWESPWGAGRPGWHIECSAMGTKYLGQSFDIHGGGLDLIFPHHENEIAQSHGASGCVPVNYWMHNGFVNVINDQGEAEKMAKSLGNFKTIRDLLEVYSGETLRVFILNSHYRTPLDFSFELLDAAKAGLDRLYTALRNAAALLGEKMPRPSGVAVDLESLPEGALLDTAERFFAAMDDDFNTPQALAALFDAAKSLNRAVDDNNPVTTAAWARLLQGLGGQLGLLAMEPEAWFHSAGKSAGGEDGLTPEAIEALIAERAQARKDRNFARADAIRDELAAKGVKLEDTPQGAIWSYAG
ncbi:cysteine--tRNA ligase [Magnetofaba australis]|uniref:Cysteine--tRNA ligase n=1 Tax=Magnetofaba australis IT-1 TaxID=1434232 RepID=A0A1Y2K3V8_9PROT|nr:cysteine--tRNA ligase [Magnetofaba australis]OSM01794.1 putative cysteinyl-tRNA synthetase [Magnetofaba australis IT-1]